MKSFSAFFVANTVAHAHRQCVSQFSCDHRPISCAHSAVAVAAPARSICHTLCSVESSS